METTGPLKFLGGFPRETWGTPVYVPCSKNVFKKG
jgi:hypothetical protein